MSFGSRARGDWRPGAGIDLAIDAPGMSSACSSTLRVDIDELPLVYPLGVVRLDGITPPPLAWAIAADGVVAWQGPGSAAPAQA